MLDWVVLYLMIPNIFSRNQGGIDAGGILTGDDTGGDVWVVVRARDGIAFPGGSAGGELLYLSVQGGGNGGVLTEIKSARNHPHDLPRSC